MTLKPFVYSDHARQRLRERQITRQHVRWVLAQGIRAPSLTVASAPRWSCRGAPDGTRELVVIFIEDARQLTIVTTYWLS